MRLLTVPYYFCKEADKAALLQTWLLVGYVLGNHHHVDGHTEQSNIEVLNAAIHSVVAKIVTILGALRLAEILTSHDGPRPATNATFAMQWQHIRVLPSLLVSIAGLLMFCAEKGLLLKFANQHLDVSVLVLGATCVAALLHFCMSSKPVRQGAY